MAATMTMGLHVSDVTGQKTYKASEVPAQSTVGEFLSGLLGRMGLGRNDPSGRPITYRARLDREGRNLAGSEVIGDALLPDDHLVLHPNIDAG
jgi:hypothetical protein